MEPWFKWGVLAGTPQRCLENAWQDEGVQGAAAVLVLAYDDQGQARWLHAGGDLALLRLASGSVVGHA